MFKFAHKNEQYCYKQILRHQKTREGNSNNTFVDRYKEMKSLRIT